MNCKEEILIWNETKNLMNNKLVQVDISFLDTLKNEKTSLPQLLSRYKFVAKMIPIQSEILELSCNKGFGSFILGEMAKNYLGFDNNASYIAHAQKNIINENFQFTTQLPKNKNFNAIIDLNSYKFLENIYNYDNQLIKNLMKENGIFILGIINQVNNPKLDIVKYQDLLYQYMQKFYYFIFKFHAYNHIINSGFSSKADLLLLICLDQKK